MNINTTYEELLESLFTKGQLVLYPKTFWDVDKFSTKLAPGRISDIGWDKKNKEEIRVLRGMKGEGNPSSFMSGHYIIPTTKRKARAALSGSNRGV
jgi:hypothetical protein